MPQPHVLIYHKHFGYDLGQYIKCECCHAPAVEVHHVIPRSHFGKKIKHLQDDISNLIAVCRACHDKCHNHIITKEQLKTIIANR